MSVLAPNRPDRIPGLTRRVPFVEVCEAAMCGSCPQEHEADCEKYHIYIRPATIEIIRRMYPIKVTAALLIVLSSALICGLPGGDSCALVR